MCKGLAVGKSSFIALGIHGDGVPHQKNRSMEIISWNFIANGFHRRFPAAIVEKHFCCKCGCSGRHTIEPLLEIISWSLKCLYMGRYPAKRHDESEFSGAADKCRIATIRQDLPSRAGLLQIRGDWSWYKQVFSFPSWANEEICWMCMATRGPRAPFRDFSLSAIWRQSRYRPGQLWRKMATQGVTPSCIFSLPMVTEDMVTVDVLHAMDLGVSQDILGNLFWEMVWTPGVLGGGNQEARTQALWVLVKAHYKAMKTENRLQKLTLTMIRTDSKPPKMRAKGAETRNLIPFGVEAARLLADARPGTRSDTIVEMVAAIFDVYMLMGLPTWYPEVAAAAARKCALLYAALSAEAVAADRDWQWRIKPKFHMFIELMEFQSGVLGNPSTFWTYSDEAFVGWCAELGMSRGGPKAAATAAKKVLDRFRCMEEMDD